MKRFLLLSALVVTQVRCASIRAPGPTDAPLARVVDVHVGATQEVVLWDGRKAQVSLLELRETRDDLCSAVIHSQATVRVNDQTVTLTSGLYRLPVTVGGVQIDCPVTKFYNSNSSTDAWGLVEDARLRLWPAGSPWTVPGAFVYPVRQRWFASDTQMGNDPCYVDGCDLPGTKNIYYHFGMDIGGCEGMIDVVSASDGVVASSGRERQAGHEGTPVDAKYDTVYVLGADGDYYRYSHLKTIEPAIRLGAPLKAGQKIGLLGKEYDSGGWSHLHFGIYSRQPSGKWGATEGYPFLWEAYLREHPAKVMAVARPHHHGSVGAKVVLDGARSWSASGRIARYDWTFTDGASAAGPQVERVYPRQGEYSEILKVTDADGRIDYDFAVVQILDKDHPGKLSPAINADYAPTFGLQPGDPVTFKVRTFRTTEGKETWDFGDGSPAVTVQSDGCLKPLAPDGYAVTVHRYAKAGLYVARVERSTNDGLKAVAHLKVRVGPED